MRGVRLLESEVGNEWFGKSTEGKLKEFRERERDALISEAL